MSKQKAADKQATITALVNERTHAEAEEKKYREQRADAERQARLWQKKVRELNEKIAQAATS